LLTIEEVQYTTKWYDLNNKQPKYYDLSPTTNDRIDVSYAEEFTSNTATELTRQQLMELLND